MDKVIWVDEDDNFLGEISFDKAHQEGLLHRVSAIYLINDQGEILIQHRADGRLDHSSAGHVDPGESYKQAAIRELKEELGVNGVDLEEYSKTKAIDEGPNNDQKRYHLFQVYVTKANPVKIDPKEVKTVYWASPQSVLKDMQENQHNNKYTRGFLATILEILKYLRVPHL